MNQDGNVEERKQKKVLKRWLNLGQQHESNLWMAKLCK